MSRTDGRRSFVVNPWVTVYSRLVVYMRMDRTVLYIVSFICVIILSLGVPDDDPRRGSNMLD
jgi:hypothetical protein